LLDNTEAIVEAIQKDFGHRCAEESKILEIFPIIDGIRDTRKRLRKWTKPQKRHVSVLFATGKNRLLPQPKGVVGIVSPWNYPLFLAMGPLTSALAAGNRAMIKMAANSQNLARLLADKFSDPRGRGGERGDHRAARAGFIVQRRHAQVPSTPRSGCHSLSPSGSC
jgi:coniferyl-aldehyde dehydrogenase